MMSMDSLLFARRGCVWVLLLCWMSAFAQEGRDPTVAPGESAATGASPMGVEGMTVLVRDNKPYLVVGTRLYAVGEKVGMMRVDRISESEVWLHDGRALIKVPRFSGIERTTVNTRPACATGAPAQTASVPAAGKASQKARRAPASPASHATDLPPVTAPCEDTQP